jgi:hypothetical protein
MTKLLETAIAKLRKLPPARQDEAAELLLSMVEQDPGTLHLSPEQVAEVERRLGEPADYVAHDAVRAFFQNTSV